MKLFFSALLLLSFTSTLNAEALRANSADDVAKNTHLANINALLIFTSQNGLNTGLFHFTEVGVDMEIYNLPLKYHFKSNSEMNYFLVGGVGYSRVYISQDVILPPESRLTYDNHLRTYTAGLGGGARYKYSEELKFLAGVELIYSRSGASVKQPDDDIGDAIEDFFDKNYNDNISYKFFIESVYKPKLDTFNPYAKLGYTLYDTKSDFSFDELSSLKSESRVLSASLGLVSNKLFADERRYLILEGYLNHNYLSGAVEKSVKFNNYSKLGLIAYYYSSNTPSWMERLFVETSVVSADGLDGYNIGVGFSLKY